MGLEGRKEAAYEQSMNKPLKGKMAQVLFDTKAGFHLYLSTVKHCPIDNVCP